uniref:NOT2/NOT3/NOT5 C-terminal domain-containing protein n=1 Tax=Brassica campestris TaxID=3711 RepID=M4EPI3_BRACM
MSSCSNSTSSLTGSTSSVPDGSGRTFTPFFPQFGSMSPVLNPDGTLQGVYDVKDHIFFPTSNVSRAGPRNSGLNGVPYARFYNSSRAPPPPSSMGNTAGGVSMSRALVFDGGSILSSTGSMAGGGLMSRALISDGGSIMSSIGSMDGSTKHNRSMMIGLHGFPQVYSMPGSSYPSAAGEHFQTHVQAMNSLSSMSLMNSNYMTTDYQMDLHQQELMMQSQQSSTGGPPTIGSRSVNAATGYDDQPLRHHQNTSQFGGEKLPAIGQPIRDVGSQPTQAATQSTPDPFSMLGLVNVINQTNPDVTTLALGVDLQEIGLDMTSKEKLFKTFASPWANEPLKEDHEHFDLPQCYNGVQVPPPNQGMFRRFDMNTLFYIFYSNNRYWFYHKEHKCWFKRTGIPLVQTNAYERGTYDCFDPDKFETVQKENFVIYYEMLERRPSLPQHRV